MSSGLIARQIQELDESFAAGPALQLSLFQDTSDWPPFVLFCAESARRPEKWTRTRKAVSRRSVTVDCVCFVLFLVYIFDHKTTVAGGAAAAGGAGGALRAGASLVTVDVLTGHICSVSFCLYVPTERDKYVWLVQSRRRPEKWTRTWEAGSRGSATPDPVSGSCVVFEKTPSQVDGGGLLHRAAQAQHRQAL